MYSVIIKDKTFNVEADTKKEAINAVADYLDACNMHDYFKVASDFSSECDIGDDVEEYAASLGFYRYGNNGIYVPVVNVEEVAQ